MDVASPQLVAQLLRKNNCYSLRRTHPKCVMTMEKGSLSNKRNMVDSGLCNRKAVDVTPDENGIPVLSLKNDRAADMRKPDKMWTTITLSGGVTKALARTDKALEMYRPAARKYAKAKVSAIYKSLSRKERGMTRASLKTGRNVTFEE